MENFDFNWILLGITVVLTAFITYVRVMDYRKHQAMVIEFNKNEKDAVLIYEEKKNIYLYIGMSVAIFVTALYIGTSLVEKITMAVVFTVLIGTELLNALMTSKLYASSKSFLFGVKTQKYRSIKKYEAKGKHNTKILLLNKTEMIIPNAYASALEKYIKSLKDAKK